MDNASDSTISFDKDGYCNYCNDVLRRKDSEYHPDPDRTVLAELFDNIKENCRNDPYDCIVGVSGGIDSSFILKLGYDFGLRMLAVHLDDGMDNAVAVENLKKLSEKTGCEIASIRPDHDEYADILYSMFKASVPTLAMAQDNLIIKAIQDFGIEKNIKYSLDGSNFAHESILERGDGINAMDRKFILAIQKQFGTIPIVKTKFASLNDRYIKRNYFSSLKHLRPLNDIEYDLSSTISELEEFCDFRYYGGKHYESILTRFLQCYYLPVKFGIDKRKSHYSSLIMSGQISREEALQKMEQPLYPSEELLQEDKRFIAEFIGISLEELDRCISLPPVNPRKYPHSVLNELAPVARKFRKFLE